ncbi:dienelactone hydrolase family protein [Thalassotalea ponticola]|uniref:dienelactone hydrolase family protein n=1 Tax=Thalassotalea ponticola TaxID=1523392 RepID=UPI0025B61C96|nr:dienelactone hydrolase family protein [Thalassotalea ponticola]MDN3653827.1 dienelactone hydrolase family protein [Thalassotalea ponticola]
MKKWLYSAFGAAILAAGYGIYHIETEYAGIGLPWNSRVDLPTLPQYDNVKSKLDEGDKGIIYFPSKSPYDFSVLLTDFDNSVESTGMGTLYFPENASELEPVPAMIILHGSGGIREEREQGYVKLFNKLGIAAFVLDYYTPRGVTNDHKYLQKTLSASETDIVVDAYNALKVLSTHPRIDATRIGVTGYSYGGMATRYTMDARVKSILAPEHPGFALHADFYGPCHQTLGSNQTTAKPYLAIFGDSDNSVNPTLCSQVHQALEDAGSDVEVLIIAGAGHAWENNQPRKERDFPYIKECRFSFQAETGLPTINGQLTSYAANNATREERAFARAKVMMDAPECIGKGYIIGFDENADNKAKAKLTEFVSKHLLNANSTS